MKHEDINEEWEEIPFAESGPTDKMLRELGWACEQLSESCSAFEGYYGEEERLGNDLDRVREQVEQVRNALGKFDAIFNPHRLPLV